MDVVNVLGKSSFRSDKKNTDYYTLHTTFRRDGVEGYAVDVKFVSADLFNKVVIGKSYTVIYGAYSNGRAFIADLQEVVRSGE